MQRALLIQFLAPAFLVAGLAAGWSAPATNAAGAKADTNATPAKPGSKTTTNTPPAEAPIPLSRFAMPTDGGGKDPFFPLSERLRVVRASVTNPTSAPPVVIEFFIKGFSGTAAFPLVIINDKTFAVDDEKEIVTPQGRIRVRCVEIRLNEEIAVIEARGERRELRFRRGK